MVEMFPVMVDIKLCVYVCLGGRACPCVRYTGRLGSEGPDDSRAARATGEAGGARL